MSVDHIEAITDWIGERPGWSWLVSGRGWEVFRLDDGSILFEGYNPTMLLWALAVEVDEHQSTRTGERVCRACSGSGEVWAWGRSDLSGAIDPDGAGPPDVGELRLLIEVGRVRHVFMANIDRTLQRSERERWAWREPCRCDPDKTRPVTRSLARMVRLLATLGDAPYGDLPDAWAVDLDAMRQAGLLDVVVPSESTRAKPRTTRAWMCRWWVAFEEWSIAGEEPDVEALAADVEALARVRRERIKCPTCKGASVRRCCSCSAEVKPAVVVDLIRVRVDRDLLVADLQCEGCIEESLADI